MSDRCPGIFRLERLHAGDEPDPAIAEHVQSCEACSRRMADIRADEAALMLRLPPAVLADRVTARAATRRSIRPLLAALGVAVPVAVAATLVLVLPGDPSGPGITPPSDLTRKGGEAVTLFRLRDGQVSVPAAGEPFRAGDRLRFRVAVPAPGFAYVFSADAGGRVFPGLPAAGAGLPVEPGPAVELPGSIELDASESEERLYVVVLSAPTTWPDLVAAVRPQVASGLPERLDLPGEVVQQSYRIR